MKICKDCKYFDPTHNPFNPYCTKHTYEEQDPVTGKVKQLGIKYAEYARQPSDPKPLRYVKAFLFLDKKYLKQLCGPEAIYYEAK